MSIYIKGMEMPIQCLSCPLWKLIHVKGIWKDYCGASNCIIKDVYSRSDWCPLVDVPPHGTLIDADKIPWRGGTWEANFDYVTRQDMYNFVPAIIEAEEET